MLLLLFVSTTSSEYDTIAYFECFKTNFRQFVLNTEIFLESRTHLLKQAILELLAITRVILHTSVILNENDFIEYEFPYSCFTSGSLTDAKKGTNFD